MGKKQHGMNRRKGDQSSTAFFLGNFFGWLWSILTSLHAQECQDIEFLSFRIRKNDAPDQRATAGESMMRSPIRTFWFVPIFLLLFMLPATAATPDPVGEVLACMGKNVPSTTTVQEIELHSKDTQADDYLSSIRILRATVYTKRFPDDLLRVLAYFHDPFHVRGTRVLMVERRPLNDSYFYAPAFGKVMKLTARNVSSSLHGTDFSYEDLERLYGMFQESTFSRLPDGEVHGSPAFILGTEAAPKKRSGYQRILTYVDKKTCVVSKMELYESGNRLRKTFEVVPESVREVNGHWIPHEMVMKDEKTTTDTRLFVRRITMGGELPETYFEKGNLDEFQPL